MSYLVSIAFSLVACVLQFACTITGGNAAHLRHGRTPNATFVLFPAIPCYPLLFVGVQFFLPHYALWVFAGICLFLFVQWLVFAFQLRAERRRAVATDHPTPTA